MEFKKFSVLTCFFSFQSQIRSIVPNSSKISDYCQPCQNLRVSCVYKSDKPYNNKEQQQNNRIREQKQMNLCYAKLDCPDYRAYFLLFHKNSVERICEVQPKNCQYSH